MCWQFFTAHESQATDARGSNDRGNVVGGLRRHLQGIEDLEALTWEQRTAIMCSEGDHRNCHRYKLITPALEESDVHVMHIQSDGSLVDEEKEPKQLSLF